MVLWRASCILFSTPSFKDEGETLVVAHQVIREGYVALVRNGPAAVCRNNSHGIRAVYRNIASEISCPAIERENTL